MVRPLVRVQSVRGQETSHASQSTAVRRWWSCCAEKIRVFEVRTAHHAGLQPASSRPPNPGAAQAARHEPAARFGKTKKVLPARKTRTPAFPCRSKTCKAPWPQGFMAPATAQAGSSRWRRPSGDGAMHSAYGFWRRSRAERSCSVLPYFDLGTGRPSRVAMGAASPIATLTMRALVSS